MLEPRDTVVVYSDDVVDAVMLREKSLDGAVMAALPRAGRQLAQGTGMMLLATVPEFANG
jgi:hypothetical protein